MSLLLEKLDAQLPVSESLVADVARGRRLAGVPYLDSLASHRAFGTADLALAARAAGFLAGGFSVTPDELSFKSGTAVYTYERVR